jgi:FMN reductase
MRIAVVTGNPKPGSRTQGVALAVADALAAELDGTRPPASPSGTQSQAVPVQAAHYQVGQHQAGQHQAGQHQAGQRSAAEPSDIPASSPGAGDAETDIAHRLAYVPVVPAVGGVPATPTPVGAPSASAPAAAAELAAASAPASARPAAGTAAHPSPHLVIDLAEHAVNLFESSAAELSRLSAEVAAADIAIFASPTYKAAYTGMLKAFLDRYGHDGLAGTVAVPVMTGGWPGHLLAVEVHLRPVLVELGATVPARGLYVTEPELATLDAVVAAWAKTAVPLIRRALAPG